MKFKENFLSELFELFTSVTSMFTNPRLFRFWIGPQPVVMVHGAEEAEVILSSNKHLNKSVHYDFVKPWLGLGLLTRYAAVKFVVQLRLNLRFEDNLLGFLIND